MNHKAMLELADHMEKMPREQFDMSSFGWRNDRRRRRVTLKNPCGTTCCIAGEKVLLDGGEMRFSGSDDADFYINDKPISASDYARSALGLSDHEGFLLFFNCGARTPNEAAYEIRAMEREDEREEGAR